MNDSSLGPPAPPRDELLAELVALRRELHQHPEVSGHERATAQRVAEAIQRLGVRCELGVGGHGVVVDLPGARQGPAVALRADLDALPIRETTQLSFASRTPGVMHACGHDGHASALVGALRLLLAGAPPPLPVRLIWQPAEETASGARAMLQSDVLRGVELIFGGHLDVSYPTGRVVATEGAVNASVDIFELEVLGGESHAARPHLGVDALVVGCHLVTALQTLVARRVPPGSAIVVSVGRFHAGSADNVLAGAAKIGGTLRAHDPALRAHVLAELQALADTVGAQSGARTTLAVEAGAPAVINRGAAVELAREAARAVTGRAPLSLVEPNLGGEDFGYFLQHVAGAYVRFGARPPGRERVFPAHSGGYDFDESALPTAARWFAEVARRGGQWLLDPRRGRSSEPAAE